MRRSSSEQLRSFGLGARSSRMATSMEKKTMKISRYLGLLPSQLVPRSRRRTTAMEIAQVRHAAGQPVAGGHCGVVLTTSW